MTGVLAIWNDCAPEGLVQYESWYLREHMQERVAVPGFRAGRRYEAVAGSPRFFTFYEVDSPLVLSGAEYLARLDAPTPGTIRAMASFRNMNRTVCEVARRHGALMGAWVVTTRFRYSGPGDAEIDAVWRRLSGDEGVAALHLWVAATSWGRPKADSSEFKLRGGADDSVAAALIVECVRHGDAERTRGTIEDWLAERSPHVPGVDVGIYQFLAATARGG